MRYAVQGSGSAPQLYSYHMFNFTSIAVRSEPSTICVVDYCPF